MREEKACWTCICTTVFRDASMMCESLAAPGLAEPTATCCHTSDG